MTIIQMGKTQKGEFEMHEIKIVSETEKAIQIQFTETLDFLDEIKENVSKVWLPKSQIEIVGEFIVAPKWLAKKHGLPTISITCLLSDTELREKTGLDFDNLTPRDRIALLEKGYGRISK